LIIIFNGPPGSGKDEAASYFKRLGFKHLSFKYVLFQETISYFGVTHDWFMKDYDNRKVKERPEKALKGMSRREALIHVSEEVIKPVEGLDFFGRCVAEEIRDTEDYAVSDGGFIEELTPIINKIGTGNIVLVQLTREGCNYSTDSRRYFDGNLVKEFVLNHQTPIKKQHVLSYKFDIKTYRIHNNSTIEDFYGVLQEIYQSEKAVNETGEEGKAA
jgi:dephospho-CoA kinase